MRILYDLLFHSAVPFILARLYWRGRRNPAYRERIAERFGSYDRPSPALREVIWIHAVSVGETEAAAPLVRALRERHPAIPLLVTTTTPTGSARVAALFPQQVEHCYLPYDLPGAVARFLSTFRPRLAIILETEIWPNLYSACGRASIPLVIVNARMSERSRAGYARLRALLTPSLAAVSAVGAQTAEDLRRFASLGADPKTLSVTGNLKFDVAVPSTLLEQGKRYREGLFGNRPLLLAASTHDGEEQAILERLGALRTRFPQLLLVLAPRHPERFAEVAALSRKMGYPPVLRSEKRACPADEHVFVLDSLGELKAFCVAADITFVGGSLVPVGGHNVLEPAAAGCPVLFGPQVANFAEICAGLVAANGAIQVADVSALAERIAELFANPERRMRMGANAEGFVAANRGALERTLALLEPYISDAATTVRTSATATA